MRKYKLAIYAGLNVGDIMKLPCVRKCEKVYFDINTLEGGTFYSSHSFVYTLQNGQQAHNGDWIVQDICDNWHVMKKSEYEAHKDDEIQEERG